MKTKKLKLIISILKSGMAFLAGALVVSLFFAISGAIYSSTRKATATLTFPGIYISLENVTYTVQNSSANGCLKYNDGTSHDINGLALAQETNYTIELPYITAEARSVAFYARAKFVYTFYDEDDEVMNSVNEATFLSDVFTTYSTNGNSLLEFTSKWKKHTDNYYYYVDDNTAGITVANLDQIGATNNSETVDIFTGSNHQAAITTGTWTAVNGVRQSDGVKTVKIEFQVEMVEVSAGTVGTDWSLSAS